MSYTSEEAVRGPGYIDQAKEQHIKELESLASEYKAHICSLDTEVQELAKQPMLDQGSGLQVLRKELTNEKYAFKKHVEVCHIIFTMEKLIHFATFSLPFALEEKEKAMQKDGERSKSWSRRSSSCAARSALEDTSCLLCGCSLLSANLAQDWADLRNAALDRLKEENAALLQRLSALEASGTYSVPPATDAMADRPSITTKLVPRAS
jgi:mitotic spindle assembly checkpoint protein MAD1